MLADSYFKTATVHQFTGDYAASIADAQEILRISQSIGHVWTQIIGLFYAGDAYTQQGEYGRAFKNIYQGLGLAENAGIVAYTDIAQGKLLLLYLESGAQELAEPLAEDLYHNRDRLVFGFASFILSTIARLRMLTGDLQQAEKIIREAYLDAGSGDHWLYFVTSVQTAEAYLMLAQARPEQALKSLANLVERIRRTRTRHFLPEPLLVQGKALTALNDPDRAGELLREARAVAAKIGQRRVLWQILAALVEIEAQQGNSGKARIYRQEARSIVEYIADHNASDELRSSFLSMPAVKSLLLN